MLQNPDASRLPERFALLADSVVNVLQNTDASHLPEHSVFLYCSVADAPGKENDCFAVAFFSHERVT